MNLRMDERTLELFNRSFEACVGQAEFLKRFYEIFIESSPEVRAKFKDTDFVKQNRVLKKSLLRLTMAAAGTASAGEEIASLGRQHGREGLRIGADLYDLWLDCLLRAVSEFDPKWSPEVGDSWRKMFGRYISILKSYS